MLMDICNNQWKWRGKEKKFFHYKGPFYCKKKNCKNSVMTKFTEYGQSETPITFRFLGLKDQSLCCLSLLILQAVIYVQSNSKETHI